MILRTREMNATVFAFAHALTAVLTWIKKEVSYLLLGAGNSVCDVWISFQDVRSVLTELASLCHRVSGLVFPFVLQLVMSGRLFRTWSSALNRTTSYLGYLNDSFHTFTTSFLL